MIVTGADSLLIVSNALNERYAADPRYREVQEMADPTGRVSPLIASTMAIDAVASHALSEEAAARARAVANILGCSNLTLEDCRAMIIAALGGEDALDATR